jgi:hypothetical protein
MEFFSFRKLLQQVYSTASHISIYHNEFSGEAGNELLYPSCILHGVMRVSLLACQYISRGKAVQGFEENAVRREFRPPEVTQIFNFIKTLEFTTAFHRSLLKAT